MNLIEHYDLLIEEGNDPVHDPKPLQDYMDKWDGQDFIDKLKLDKAKAVLEIGTQMTESYIKKVGLKIIEQSETEFAHIFCCN